MGKEITSFDYEKERAKFIWDIPEDYNFVDTIRKWAADRTKLMVIAEHPDGKVEKAAYWEVWDNAMRLGNILQESGIQKGDRVMVILPRGNRYLCCKHRHLGSRRCCRSRHNNAKESRYRIQGFRFGGKSPNHW
jgi:long-subunit acyl-CoA synthetase (AMP-forming)